MSSQFVESLKEFVRTGLIAAIPVIIDGLMAGAIDWRLAGVASGVAALRAVDKYLHELGVKSPLDLQSLDALKG